MNFGKSALVPALAAALVAGAASQTARAAEQEWSFEVMPYLWAAGLKGDLSIRNQDIEVSSSFSELMDMMEIGGGMLMRAERNQWVWWTQADYMAMNTDKLDDPPEHARLDSNTLILTAGLGRNFGGSENKRSIDVLLGVRYFELENKLRFDSLGTFRGKRDYTDPLLILRPSFRLSDRWRFNPTFSFGAGGDSDDTYELQPQVQFQMTEHSSLRFGYRKLHYDVENSSNGNGFEGSFEGVLIGVSGTFGGAR